jgi:dihydrofolate reductase
MSLPRIEGYAVISREGMIAEADGSFPDAIKVEADQIFYHAALARADAIANGRHSAEVLPFSAGRPRLVLTRRVATLKADPGKPHVIYWNPAGAHFAEASRALRLDHGTLAVVGGTDVFGVFLTIGYDSFFLSRTLGRVPDGRPVFPGVGPDFSAQEILQRSGYRLHTSRVLDVPTNTILEEYIR